MENIHHKLWSLNDSLRGLQLDSVEERANIRTDHLLLGKVLTTRSYRRFTVTEIVSKIWRLRKPIKVEKLDNNTFNFQFGCKEDREHIYQLRPWSLDGAHLILKLWPKNKTLSEISFDITTLWLQILHQGMAEKISSRVGILHKETVTKRCVVGHRFLRVRVDISLKNALPPGFFYDRVNDDELWVQFKYERLPDFCLKCGFLDHVTGRCKFESLATITSAHGIRAKTYGPWLKAEVTRNLEFVNLLVDAADQRQHSQNGHSREMVVFGKNTRGCLCERIPAVTDESSKTYTFEEIQLACNMCNELKALTMTLKRQVSSSLEEVNAALLHQIRLSNHDPQLLAKWATKALHKVSRFDA